MKLNGNAGFSILIIFRRLFLYVCFKKSYHCIKLTQKYAFYLKGVCRNYYYCNILYPSEGLKAINQQSNKDSSTSFDKAE